MYLILTVVIMRQHLFFLVVLTGVIMIHHLLSLCCPDWVIIIKCLLSFRCLDWVIMIKSVLSLHCPGCGINETAYSVPCLDWGENDTSFVVLTGVINEKSYVVPFLSWLGRIMMYPLFSLHCPGWVIMRYNVLFLCCLDGAILKYDLLFLRCLDQSDNEASFVVFSEITVVDNGSFSVEIIYNFHIQWNTEDYYSCIVYSCIVCSENEVSLQCL